MSEERVVKGYKVFNSDWTCRNKQYTCPGVFEEDVTPVQCEQGMHFCRKAIDCFNYYAFDPKNKVAEVIAHGDIVEDGNKCCTNKLEITREISWHELLELVNTGKGCTGHSNSGNYNSGNYNSGDYNSGNHNSGDYNSGNHNSGDYNSGDWNKCIFSNGCFNTTTPKIYMFNKPSKLTYKDWFNSKARDLLNQITCSGIKYIYFCDMTDEEKAAHPEAETTEGYLKQLDNKENTTAWWKKLSESEKETIMAIPNFDKKIFKEITGIDVDK